MNGGECIHFEAEHARNYSSRSVSALALRESRWRELDQAIE